MDSGKKFDIVEELIKIIRRKDEEIKKYKVEWDKAQDREEEEEDYNERMYLEHLEELWNKKKQKKQKKKENKISMKYDRKQPGARKIEWSSDDE